MRVCGIAVRNRAENRSRRRLHSKDVKTFEPASHRLGHFADEGGSSLPMGRRQTHQRSEVRDNRIAVVFEVKFEPLGRKYCCASRRSAILSCKRQRGALKQKNSADPSFDVTGNPEAFLVTADEKCGDRLVDDPGIERPKLCGNRWRVLDRQGCGAFGFPLDCSRRTRWHSPDRVWARSLHGDHWVFIDDDDVPGTAAHERAGPALQSVAPGY